MVKLLIAVVFSVLLLVPGILSQDAFAVTKDYTGPNNGNWAVAGSWTPAGIPASNDDVVISGTTPVINSNVLVSQGGSITISNANNLLIFGPNTLTNRGGTIITGTATDIFVQNGATFLNDCSGVLQLGPAPGSGAVSAELNISSGGTAINHGLIFEVPNGRISVGAGGLFQNSGEILAPIVGSGTVQQIPSPCSTIGGELLPIDTTALLLASAQGISIWMIPVLAGAAGVGAFYIKTRMSKE